MLSNWLFIIIVTTYLLHMLLWNLNVRWLNTIDYYCSSDEFLFIYILPNAISIQSLCMTQGRSVFLTFKIASCKHRSCSKVIIDKITFQCTKIKSSREWDGLKESLNYCLRWEKQVFIIQIKSFNLFSIKRVNYQSPFYQILVQIHH